MRQFYTLLIALFISAFGFGQTNPGDIAFTAFNADGDDDFAIVALVDIPANTEIYFTDNEPATATTLTGGEGTILWDSGSSIISAGTIVVFTDTDSGSNTNFGSSFGTLTYQSGSLNLAGGGDALYAFIGASATSVTSWLAGIQNEAGNQGNLGATGLTSGSTFVEFYTSGSPDGGYYSGNRDTEFSFSDYLNLIGDSSNWTRETSNGENILPISTTPFTITGGSSPTITLSETSITDLDYVDGNGPSAEQTFTAEGSNLTNNIVITAPTNFEISETAGSGFGSSITLTQTGGTVNNTTIFVRLISSLAVNTYNGTLTATSAGATQRDVNLSGEVTAAPPTNDDCINATPLTVNNSCSFSIFTNESGSNSGALPVPGCGSYSGADVWFSVVVPASGNLDIDTSAGDITDGAMALYSGSCGSLTLIECDDDGGTDTMPFISASGLLPGSTVYILFWEFGGNAEGTFGICAVDPVIPPSMTLSETSLSGFMYEEGSGPSAEQTFTAEGSNLTDDIVITAPANFEISETSGSGYSSSITLTQTGGTVSSTIIFVRLIDGLSINTYNGTITATSSGATQQDISLDGEVTAVSCAGSATTFPFNGVSGTTNLEHTSSNSPGPSGESCGDNYRIFYDSQPSTDSSGNFLRSNTTDELIESNDWGGEGKFETFAIDVSSETTIAITTFGNTTGNGFNAGGEQFQWWYTLDGGAQINLGSAFTGTGSLGIAETTVDVTGINSLVVGFTFDMNGGSDGFEDVDVTVDLPSPTTYTFNSGTWTPSDPNGVSLASEAIVIEAGDAVISTDTDINTVTVNPGASLTVDSGATLTIADATDGLTLESTSSSYSSLIRNGNISGTIYYERYVNQITSGSPGNDLVSIPLTAFDLNFQSFLAFGDPQNRDLIATNPGNTVHAFGPYDNTNLEYVNFPTYLPSDPPDPAAEPLISGKGYRAATTAGSNITFTGNALSADVSIAIGTPTAVVNSQWNLIGNPYPSYLDANKFLLANSVPMEDTAEAIYAYNSATYTGGAATTGNFTIINLATIAAFPGESFNIAPGQGFFVPADITPGFTGTINFATGPTTLLDMRTTSGTDDYIQGRSSDVTYAFKLGLTTNTEVTTTFFFNDNATRGLDPGYDAATFGGGNLYSHLVENNTGKPMALQALSLADMSDVVIPLGVNANQGEQLTFSISLSTLPEGVDVYLEDNITNTVTLLNSSDYILTPSNNLSGTGRFYLRFTNTALSNPETDLDTINIYVNQNNRTIVVEGQLLEDTDASIYDLQGRLVNKVILSASELRQNINASHLSSGVYVVQLENDSQNRTVKVILK